jgi:hypothetical protein
MVRQNSIGTGQASCMNDFLSLGSISKCPANICPAKQQCHCICRHCGGDCISHENWRCANRPNECALF